MKWHRNLYWTVIPIAWARKVIFDDSFFVCVWMCGSSVYTYIYIYIMSIIHVSVIVYMYSRAQQQPLSFDGVVHLSISHAICCPVLFVWMLFRLTKDLSVLICKKKGVRRWKQQRQRYKGLRFFIYKLWNVCWYVEMLDSVYIWPRGNKNTRYQIRDTEYEWMNDVDKSGTN